MILNYILCIAVFLGLIAGSYAHAVTGYVRGTSRIMNLNQAALLAESGLDIGVDLLRRQRAGTLPASPITIKFENGEVTLRFEDEGGKIDINKAPLPLVESLIKKLDLGEPVKEDIVAAIRQARENSQLLASLNQIPLKTPIDSAVMEGLSRYLTTYSGLPFADPGKAPPLLATILQRGTNSGWAGTATGTAYTIISTATAVNGSQYTLAKTLKPSPLTPLGLTSVLRERKSNNTKNADNLD